MGKEGKIGIKTKYISLFINEHFFSFKLDKKKQKNMHTFS